MDLSGLYTSTNLTYSCLYWCEVRVTEQPVSSMETAELLAFKVSITSQAYTKSPVLLLACEYTSANHLFLLHYELHAEVKSIHWPSVGMLSVENMLICNIIKQKNALNWKTFYADILTEKSSQRLQQTTLSQKEFKKEWKVDLLIPH